MFSICEVRMALGFPDSRIKETQFSLSKSASRPGMVAYTWNSSYLGGRDWEDLGLRTVWAKMLAIPYLKNKLRMSGSFL
jgi:hypothetical protein